jgi:nicotinate-nucleotide adenylyltransferase
VRLGVMGGTFDPIHTGHLRAAETAREALGLERVVFVPAGVPPHREAPRACALDRWTMVCLAIADHPHFEASDVELSRPGPSFTVDTVQALRAAYPQSELTLIVGSDTLPEMTTWRDLDGIVASCRVAVVRRPGEEAALSSPLPPWADAITGVTLLLSATEIRGRLGRGESVRYLVPPTVAEYITRRGLYR